MSGSKKHTPPLKLILIILILVSGNCYNQSLSIKGNVSTTTGLPVYNALITFIEEVDSTKKYSVLTDSLGNYNISIITSVQKEEVTIPVKFELAQNYPNPFANQTMITYKLNQPLNVEIKIYDLLGQEVKTFRMGLIANGIHGIMWDGRNNLGDRVSPGIYFYQLQTCNETLIKKMIFGLGTVNLGSSFSRTFFSTPLEMKKVSNNQIQEKTFTIRIENNEYTNPRILIKEFENMTLQSDTTLNFIAESGKIVFVKLDTLDLDTTVIKNPNRYYYKNNVYKMNIDGTEIERLKNGNEIIENSTRLELRGSASEPRWSRDGRKIVYSESQGPDESHIVIMDADGSNRKNLTPVGAYCIRPKWSPEGDRILYLRGAYMGTITATSIVDTSADGNSFGFDLHISPESRVFEGDSVFYNLNEVQWHHDGEHLYVWGNVGEKLTIPVCGENLNGEIFLLKISTGKIVQRLTHNAVDECGFEINHIGTNIIFFRGQYQKDSKIFLMNLTDIQSKSITTGMNDYWPRWGNEGELVVYVKDEDDDPTNNPFFSNRIYIVRAQEPYNEIRVSPEVANEPNIFIE